jgi:hypothetical protein
VHIQIGVLGEQFLLAAARFEAADKGLLQVRINEI